MAGVAVATTVATQAFSAPAEQVRNFVDFVVALDQAQPVDRATLESHIGRTLECKQYPNVERTDCDARDIDFFGVKVGYVDFRSTRLGTLLILDRLSGDCVPVDQLDKRFGEGYFDSSCTDGVVCIYKYYKRNWGKLSAGLGGDRSAPCAKLLVMNTISR